MAQLGRLGPLLTRCPVHFEGLLDSIEQFLIPKGFGEKLHRSVLHGPDGHRDVPMAGDEDDRDRLPRAG